jgi:hypothetical protein
MKNISDNKFIIIIGIVATVSIITYSYFRIPENHIRTPNIFGHKNQEILSKAYPKLIHYFPDILSESYIDEVNENEDGYLIEIADRCHITGGPPCFDGCFYVYFNKKYQIYKTGACGAGTHPFHDTLN